MRKIIATPVFKVPTDTQFVLLVDIGYKSRPRIHETVEMVLPDKTYFGEIVEIDMEKQTYEAMIDLETYSILGANGKPEMHILDQVVKQ